MKTSARMVIVAVSLAAAVVAAPVAQAHEVYDADCSGASTWVKDQCDNQINDDGDNHAGKFTSDCYGECGNGCASTRCGSGGACQTHDYYTRTYGMYSSQAMGAFPAAAAQWGRCVMSAGSSSVAGSLKSSWSGIKKSASSVVNKIFN